MTLSRMFLAAAVVAAFAAAMAVAADQEARPSASDAMKHLHLIRPPSPTQAPDFTATLEDGRTFQLSSQRGKVVFINFRGYKPGT